MATEMDAEVIRAELDKLVDLGALDYVLPTDPPGERWVLGYNGQILNLSPEETMAFLAGAYAVGRVALRQRGISV